MPRKKFGLIVNPIAGMGGKVGLKGTDGAATAARARELGAEAIASLRARQALERMAAARDHFTIITCAGAMGAADAQATGLPHEVIEARAHDGATSAADTSAAAICMMSIGVDLLIFAGGDGTARDVHGIVGDKIPMLGIPAGVKMQSGVFAANPASAGNLAAALALDVAGSIRLREVEVVDVDETALREDRVSTRLYGYARAPYERLMMQNVKSRHTDSNETWLDALCSRVAAELEDDRLYILGPGRTTKRILVHLGLRGTVLGIDAVCNRARVGSDLNERQLLDLTDGRKTTVIVGVIGGQGYLFGRGNQQISATVIRRVGAENIMVVAGSEKILALDPPALRVDTGDDEIDRMLSGFVRVHVAPGQSIMVRVMA